MEKFYGLSKDTIERMRTEYAECLNKTLHENLQYPRDPHLYKRIRMLAINVQELTEELEFRNDDIIQTEADLQRSAAIKAV